MSKVPLFAKFVFFAFVLGFIGCGMSFKFVTIPEESPFYAQNKSQIKKIGITTFSRENNNLCSVIAGLFLNYQNKNLKNYNAEDTIKAVIGGMFTGKESATFSKSGKYCFSPKDSTIYEVSSISEVGYGKTPEELSAMCATYNVDAVLVGNYNYCIKRDFGKVEGEGSLMDQNDGTTDRASTEDEELLSPEFSMNFALFGKAENKMIFEKPERKIGFLDYGSSRSLKKAIRNKNKDKLAGIVLTNTIKSEIDILVMWIGKYAYLKREEPSEKK